MIALIGIGGSLGAIARFYIGLVVNQNYQGKFPLGTFTINLIGSFLLGLLAGNYLSNQLSEWAWYLFGIGFMGAFTTFSTFGYETIMLLNAGFIKKAILYVSLSILLGLLAAYIGFSIKFLV